MKKIYFFLFILFVGVFNAQVITFGDVNFKNFLVAANYGNNYAFGQFGNSIKIDTNNDGEIQQSEANLVYKISTLYYGYRSHIQSLQGIQSLNNLENIYMYGTSLNTIDVSNMPHLSSISLTYNAQLTSMNINGCSSLNRLLSEHNNILNYNLQNSTLQHININNQNSSQPLSSVNVNNCPNLEFLELHNTNIQSFDFSNMTSLKTINLYASPLTNNVNVTGCINLEHIYIDSFSSLNSLQISNLQNLNTIYLLETAISSLSIINCPNIDNFHIGANNLNNIDLSIFPLLRHFSAIYTNFTEIDLSDNPLVENVDFFNNPLLNKINFKSGGTVLNTLSWFDIVNNPSLNYICCDDDDFAGISNYLLNNGLYNIELNSYCSFTPGGTFYTIQGNTKYDFDINGCSPTDTNKPHQKFNISGGGQSGSLISNSTGNYSIPVQAGNHTITPILENPTYWTISPSSFTASFPSQTSPLTQNFCISANGTHNDLEVVIVPITAAAPGFTSKYKVIYKNKGTHTQSGNLSLSYNDNLMDFNSATTSPVTQSSGLLNWNFSNLLPFETREITVTYTLNTPTATPPLNGGDILNFNSLIIGATDETPSDNNFALSQTVVNSFDPNDKTCLEGSSIATTKVGDYVHYLVRFENTGTANAQNIVVKDLIDTTKFDLSSLVALNGSHSFITRITNPNTVEFIFENIQLPFANATNDGYVLFKIKTKSTLVLGDSFSNTANIYFDYNAPIVTNTYSTSVQNSLATDETEISNEFSIFPNPVSDFVSFKSPERIQKIEIFDLSGRIICANAVQNNSSDLSILSKGNYIIKAYSKQKTYIKKLIKK